MVTKELGASPPGSDHGDASVGVDPTLMGFFLSPLSAFT